MKGRYFPGSLSLAPCARQPRWLIRKSLRIIFSSLHAVTRTLGKHKIFIKPPSPIYRRNHATGTTTAEEGHLLRRAPVVGFLAVGAGRSSAYVPANPASGENTIRAAMTLPGDERRRQAKSCWIGWLLPFPKKWLAYRASTSLIFRFGRCSAHSACQARQFVKMLRCPTVRTLSRTPGPTPWQGSEQMSLMLTTRSPGDGHSPYTFRAFGGTPAVGIAALAIRPPALGRGEPTCRPGRDHPG